MVSDAQVHCLTTRTAITSTLPHERHMYHVRKLWLTWTKARVAVALELVRSDLLSTSYRG